MDRDPAPAPAPPPASSQGLARIALATAIVGIGLWILRDFLAALVWAGVLAVAFWPIYRRLQIPVSRPIERIVAPALATTVIGIIFIAPLVLLGIALARESHFVVDFIRDARHHGIPAPVWIGQLLGGRGGRIAGQLIAAVHGTVNWLVLVGLAEGYLPGLVYFAADLPYPAIVGAITAVAAVIPFSAPVVYSLVGLYLFTVGNTVGAVVILVSGSVIVFVADHFVRPVLIGGAARLPFLWVLLGILGGLETFGFLGLFLGPALMAALVALWREWTEAPDDRADVPRQIDTAAK